MQLSSPTFFVVLDFRRFRPPGAVFGPPGPSETDPGRKTAPGEEPWFLRRVVPTILWRWFFHWKFLLVLRRCSCSSPWKWCRAHPFCGESSRGKILWRWVFVFKRAPRVSHRPLPRPPLLLSLPRPSACHFQHNPRPLRGPTGSSTEGADGSARVRFPLHFGAPLTRIVAP